MSDCVDILESVCRTLHQRRFGTFGGSPSWPWPFAWCRESVPDLDCVVVALPVEPPDDLIDGSIPRATARSAGPRGPNNSAGSRVASR